MIVKVRRNLKVDSVRRAVDSVTYALGLHGVFVSEFQHPNGNVGVEYVEGRGKDGEVIALLDRADGKTVKWVGNHDLGDIEVGLIEAHAAVFGGLK